MLDEYDLRQKIIESYDSVELVEFLNLSMEELVELLYVPISDNIEDLLEDMGIMVLEADNDYE